MTNNPATQMIEEGAVAVSWRSARPPAAATPRSST